MKELLEQLPDVWAPFKHKVEATIKPTIELKLQKSDDVLPWQSKVGGNPYLPLTSSYPVDKNGAPLFLLAQINFAEMPALEGYPSYGLLQFFIAADDLFGLNFDNQQDQDGFRVIYHDQVVQDPALLQQDFSQYVLKEDQYLPFTGQYAIRFDKQQQAISTGDFAFGQKIFAVDNVFDYEEQYQGEDFYEDMIEPYAEVLSESGHRIGGYPFFTQTDPREYKKDIRDYVLLLQIDSDYGDNDIMWGDCGVGNFFIRPEDLKNKDFSKVFYNWDCS